MYYDDNDDYYERRDWIHINDVPDTDKMAEQLDEIVKQLYNGFDEEVFEGKLEELCDMLGVDMPAGELSIERKQKWAKTA